MTDEIGRPGRVAVTSGAGPSGMAGPGGAGPGGAGPSGEARARGGTGSPGAAGPGEAGTRGEAGAAGAVGATLEAELRQVIATLADIVDGDEPVDELAHALQCATHAISAKASPELVAAALLHDVGRSPSVCAMFPGLSHEKAGARWLKPRTSEKVAWLVAAHVPAKVFLVATDPAYFANLSAESVHSFGNQSIDQEALGRWVAHPWWPDALQLRRWDDAAKVPGAYVVSIDRVLAQLGPLLTKG